MRLFDFSFCASRLLIIGLGLLIGFSGQVSAAYCDVPIESHRGEGIENSVSAIRSALSSGFSGVEIDVRVMSDGQWVLHHDKKLGRVTKSKLGERPIARMSRGEWRFVKFKDSNERPPRFEQAVEAFAKEARHDQYLNIEIKSKPSCPSVLKLITTAKQHLDLDQIRISSMKKDTLYCARGIEQDLYVALIALPHSDHMREENRYKGARKVLSYFTEGDLDAHLDDFQDTGGRKYDLRRLIEWSAEKLGERSALHVDARSLLEYGYAIEIADAEGLGTFAVYSLDAPEEQVRQYRQLKQRRILPDVVISDANPQTLCH